jgi:hypothetical protein
MRPVGVPGASGKTGRRVLTRLRARGVAVRPGFRSARPPFDWQTPSTWRPVLEGASAAYVSYFPDLAAPRAPEAVEAVAAVALDAGAERFVLLSGRAEEEAAQRGGVGPLGRRVDGGARELVRAELQAHFREPLLAGEQRPRHRRRAARSRAPRPGTSRIRAGRRGGRRLGLGVCAAGAGKRFALRWVLKGRH